MKCSEFEHHLPDWIGDQLPFAQAQRMLEHHQNCGACQQASAYERDLRLRWQELPAPPVNPALWTRLAQRIDSAPPSRSRARFSMVPNWAMGSALAMVVLTCVVLSAHLSEHRLGAPPSYVSMTAPIDEHHIVQMVGEVQQLSDAESDTFVAETQVDRQEMRRLLNDKEVIR